MLWQRTYYANKKLKLLFVSDSQISLQAREV